MVNSANPMKFGRMKLHPARVLRQTSRPRRRGATGPLDAGGVLTMVAMCTPGAQVHCGVPDARGAGHTIPDNRHLLRTVLLAWFSASVTAASIVVLPDSTDECSAFSRFCSSAVYLETGFSGLVLCLLHANFDRSSVGTPGSEK